MAAEVPLPDQLSLREALARKALAHMNQRLGFIQVWATLGAPVCEALFLAFWQSSSSQGDFKGYLWVIFGFILFTHLLSSYFVYVSTREGTDYFSYRDLYKRYKKAEGNYRAATAMKLALYVSSVTLVDFLQKPKSMYGSEDIKNTVASILGPMIEYRSDIFNYGGDSKYNVALYLHCLETDLLKVFFRQCDDRLHVGNRTWKRSFGHVGLCFARQELMLSKDISKTPELAKDNKKSDNENYKSIVAVPVAKVGMGADETECLLGVLVVTSSHAAQFKRSEHKHFLLTLSKTLSIFLSMALPQCDPGGLTYEEPRQ